MCESGRNPYDIALRRNNPRIVEWIVRYIGTVNDRKNIKFQNPLARDNANKDRNKQWAYLRENITIHNYLLQHNMGYYLYIKLKNEKIHKFT